MIREEFQETDFTAKIQPAATHFVGLLQARSHPMRVEDAYHRDDFGFFVQNRLHVPLWNYT